MLHLKFGLLLLAFVIMDSRAISAEVVGIQVVNEAAAAGRGNVLELTSSFLKGEKTLAVRVTAFAIGRDAASAPTQTPLLSRKTSGQWTYTYDPIKPPDIEALGSQASLNRIQIPVEDLRLEDGTYLIRYFVESLGTDGRPTSDLYSTPGRLSLKRGIPEWSGLEADTTLGAQSSIQDLPQPKGSSEVMLSPGMRTPTSGEPTGGGASSKAGIVEPQPPLQPQKIWPARTDAEQKTVEWRYLNNPLNALQDASHTLVYFVSNRPWRGVKDRAKPWKGMGTTYQPFERLDTIVRGAVVVKTSIERKLGDLDSIQIKGMVGPYPESPYSVEQNQAASQFLEWIWGQDVLLFIHGYNNTFEAAAVQAAQLKADLKFPGPVVVFSWPSLAEGGGYFTDKVNAEKSLPAFADLLTHFTQGNEEDPKRFFCPPGKSFVIAHSMGNWVFLNSMGLANLRKKLRVGSLGKVVLAAPDVSRVSFLQWAPVVVSAARNVTVYYSSKDTALDLSSVIHWGKRAGQGEAVQYTLGIDAIDVDNVNSRWIRNGHSAYSASDRVLNDIALNFLGDIPVWKRSPPLTRKPSLLDYYSNWYFQ